jgi:glycosyltransferase involved in cell wall biosynthesis
MRVLYIVPGMGDAFYCQNCVRDVSCLRGLRALGHELTVVPMYLPLPAEATEWSGRAPVFYGAVRLFLEDSLPALRKLPRFLLSGLDAPPLLRWAARRAASTRAHGLERMTLSVLQGAAGGQAADLGRLLDWLRGQPAPDVIHLSNALLLGLAGPLGQTLRAPVVCSLQDEDAWVDAMEPRAAEAIWDCMRSHAPRVAVFLAVSQSFADTMRARLRLPAEQVRVIRPGVRAEDFVPSRQPFTPPHIGYLSRLSPPGGLDILVDAMLLLREDKRLKYVRLDACGGATADDRRYVAGLRRKLAACGAAGHLRILPAFDRKARAAFLQSVTVLAVPTRGPVSTGMFLLEAMAAGVPAVEPDIPSLREIVETTGGGALYSPNTPEQLAATLRPLLLDARGTRELGRRAREETARRCGIRQTAQTLADAYREAAAASRQRQDREA